MSGKTASKSITIRGEIGNPLALSVFRVHFATAAPPSGWRRSRSVMPLRPLCWLSQLLLALVLLLGAPAVMRGHSSSAELAQIEDRLAQAFVPDRRGVSSEIAAAAASADIDDDPEPLALVPPPAGGTPVCFAAAIRGFAYALAAASHWPCAGPSTGPPQR
jgi:hypothetical protein